MEISKSMYLPKMATTDVISHSVVFLTLFWLLMYLLFSSPNYTLKQDYRRYSGACPLVWGQKQDWSMPSTSIRGFDGIIEKHQQGIDLQHKIQGTAVDCHNLLNGQDNEIEYSKGFNWCQDNRPSDYYYTQIANTDCDKFKQIFGYNNYSVSNEERDFPIAFSILTYEDSHQTERLLHAIYRPQNIYCVHVDSKADSITMDAVTDIAKCFPNVIVPQNTINVHWAEYSVLEAELLCMDAVWKSGVKWKYYINLTGREFPLKTNAELVQILQVYNGANDIDGSMYNRNIDWMKYVWRAENWRTNTLKSPVPHEFNIHKGSAHIVATREFVEYVLTDDKAKDLREWMRDTRLPDEHYFNTLSHSPHFGVPGSYKGDPAMKPFYGRLKLWWQNEQSTCSGEWSRYICNLGPQELSNVVQAKHLFVNKIRRDVAPVAYECLTQWHENRTRLEKTGKLNELDIDFYKSLKFVNYHI